MSEGKTGVMEASLSAAGVFQSWILSTNVAD
jgi:hypothetical protein